eukprot:Gregarina_sp_Poly_1__4102@NODE_224_length_11220_cov_343_477450_g198_i0_p1_GENE_NODE_224_length_11220_cov_343_477450_g198_i0NODE_224_length_11220_cov_343_477450_g198_i0_p1_ORF_typecomplete_len1808_score294_16DUF3591/PF12157_8/2_7e36Bromodomain/PF00439_25/3e19_NODE_224_length_11220_cov_343_477450_g198_i043449767
MPISIDELVLCRGPVKKRVCRSQCGIDGHGRFAPPSLLYPVLCGITDESREIFSHSSPLSQKIQRFQQLTRESTFLSLSDEVLRYVKRRRLGATSEEELETRVDDVFGLEEDGVEEIATKPELSPELSVRTNLANEPLVESQASIVETFDYELALEIPEAATGGDSSGGDEASSTEGISGIADSSASPDGDPETETAPEPLSLETRSGETAAALVLNLDDLLADDAAQTEEGTWDLDSLDIGYYPDELEPTPAEAHWDAELESAEATKATEPLPDQTELLTEAAPEELEVALSLVKSPPVAEPLMMEPNETKASFKAQALWGVARGSAEEALDSLYAQRTQSREALLRSLRNEIDARLVHLTGLNPAFSQASATADLAVFQRELLQSDPVFEFKFAAIKHSVKEFYQVEKSVSIFRYMLSECGPENSTAHTRHFDIEKVIDPRAALLRTFTADLSNLPLRTTRDGRKRPPASCFLADMPRLIKNLAKRETRQTAYTEPATDADSASRRGRRPKGLERRVTTPLPTSASMLRQATEDRVRYYVLWRAWQDSLTRGKDLFEGDDASLRLRLFDSIDEPVVAKWLTQAAHIVDPFRYRLGLGISRRDAAVDVALAWQTCALDTHYKESDSYRPIGRPTDRDNNPVNFELIHAPIAWTFFGVPARPSLTQFARYHRPDFRTGLFAAHYFAVYRTPYSGQHVAAGYHNRKPPGGGLLLNSRKFDLSGGRSYGGDTSSVPAAPTASRPSTMPTKGGQALFGTWRVGPPAPSKVLEIFKTRASYSGTGGGSEVGPDHPSDLFVTSASLSLAEWVPVALFEHSTPPALVANPGMVARITRYYRPSRESVSALSQAEKKLRGRLGFFGPLQLLGDTVLTLFGGPFRVKPNQGVAFFKSTLLRGPCFTHPFDPRRPLPTPEVHRAKVSECYEPRHARQGWSSLNHFEDYRLTDFLLIRTHAVAGTNNAPVRVTLRPLFYGFGEPALQLKSPIFSQGLRSSGDTFYGLAPGDVVEALEALARVAVYTLGQCELLADIPAPDGKKVADVRKEWLKAYSLRLAANGCADFLQNKQKCFVRFGGVFDQNTINRFLLMLKKSNAGGPSTTSSLGGSGLMQSSGMLIRPVTENIIQKLVSPEQICGLESCLLGNAQLGWHGLRYLKSIEHVSVARAILQMRDIASDILWARARGTWKASHQFMGTAASSNIPELLQLPPPFRGQLPQFTTNLSGIARFIEEQLMQTPWTQQKGFADVHAKKNSQFLLGSVFDPSLGRYENLCFLKEDIATIASRDPLILQHHRQFKSLQKNRGFIARSPVGEETVPVFEEAKREKVEEMSTAQLQLNLLRAGVKHAALWRRTRSELVNLCYRLQFTLLPKDTLLSLGNQGSRLDHGDYVCRINDVQLRQRSALQLDDVKSDPQLEDTADVYDDAAQPCLDEAALEASFLDSLAEPSEAPQSTRPDRGEINAAGVRQALQDLVWNESAIFSKTQVFGHVGSISNYESQEIDRVRDALTRDQRPGIYPMSSPVLNTVVHKWMSQLHDRDVKEFLKQKQVQFIPRLRWSKSRAPNPSQPGPNEKVVYIYGEENIQKFLAWRRQRFMSQSKPKQQPRANPNRSVTAIAKSQAKKTKTSLSSIVVGRDWMNDLDDADLPITGAEMRGGLPVTASRLTARQQRLLYERHKEAEAAGRPLETSIVKYLGTTQAALDEFNQNLQRMVLGLKRFNWFWDPVKEAEAPNYYQVVRQPMWLGKIFEKTRDKQYTTISEFEKDVLLIHANCFQYNPSKHWIRPIADQLKETVQQKLDQQVYWLKELESVLAQSSK